MMNKSLSWTFTVIIPLILLALFTPWSAQMDLAISRWFYQEGYFDTSRYFSWIYHYAIFPAWIAVGLALIGWIISYFLPDWKPLRRGSLYLILVLGIGSGLFVHAILKDHWGRPRPKQIIEFGGEQTFRPYYEPRFSHSNEPSKSFPCGHASVGFYFFSFIFLGKHYQNRKLYQWGWILTFVLGSALSLARLAQGGHFLSDILVSALIMWLTAAGLYQLLLTNDSRS